MKAISLTPQTTNVALIDIPEPGLTSSHDIKIKVWQVGICGTDREEAAGGRGDAPAGKQQLIIGHEMFGQVIETGNKVQHIKRGDHGLFTVRRGCNECAACLQNRSDMCYTGKYTERGIKGADGFQAEYVVDKEQYFINVPASCKNIGVLTEPMSVAAKAIDECLMIQQARLKNIDPDPNWFKGKKALIAGLGPVGLMAAFALRLKGAQVTALDIVDEGSLRVKIVKNLQGHYINEKEIPVTGLVKKAGAFDFIFEATGISSLQLQLPVALANNGIYVITGIPAGNGSTTLQAGELLKQLVLKNQLLLGSVNAGIAHYQMAVHYLQESQLYWPGLIETVITHRFPYNNYHDALFTHSANEIKGVMEWF